MFSLPALMVLVLIVFPVSVASASETFGIERVGAQTREAGGAPAVQAGSHPYSLTVSLGFNHHPTTEVNFGLEVPDGNVRTLEAVLPAGLVVNLLGVEKCSEEQLALERCPPGSQVGLLRGESANVGVNGTLNVAPLGALAVYNVAPSSPTVPGELGIDTPGIYLIVHIVGKVHAGGYYTIGAEIPGLSEFLQLDKAELTLWGDPSVASHDNERFSLAGCKVGCEVARTGKPFLTLPTRCPVAAESADGQVREELSTSMRAESWQESGIWTGLVSSAPLGPWTGCETLSFEPSIEVKPETTVADTPTGVGVSLKIPQVESLGSPATANLREAVVTLPAGLSVSPAAVGGLEACSEAQIGLGSASAPSCPQASKIASVETVTPLLHDKLLGSVYLAQQGNAGPAQGSNPFGSLIAMYVVVEGSGILIKTAGEVSLNPITGQLTARFKNLPQLPYSELKLNFFGGPRAPLVPAVCGTYTTTSLLTPWSAPASGPPATPQSSFQVASGCATGTFNPTLSAGTTSNQAGGYSPFVATFSRQASEQELGAIQVHMPPGLLAMLSHVPLCEEPQAQTGQCGAQSEIGEVSAAVGAGEDPFAVTGGRAYLTGPYKGAPFGLTFVVPAVAGPFNLGNVIVRAAINVDPLSAAVTITSDPLPTILQGVPLQVRSVTVNVNRPEFTFNPTSCEHTKILASLQGSLGATPQESVPFQAGDCAALEFKPQFSVTASGKTSRALGASLDVRLSYPKAAQGSEANIAKVKVDLPKQLPARLKTLQQACLAATFEANPASCPAASVVGSVRATTPLLPVALSGPAYFVSYGGAKFPELIVVLQGDGVRVDLHGETFISKAGITSSTFNAIPDVPVGTFELYLPEGKYSALAANGNLCKSSLKMPTSFVAQNGAVIKQSTKIAVAGCPPLKKAKAKQARRAGNGQGKGRSS
ncbi:MAG TPA: hypothetical protein VK691_01820 [Solirubrobacteraceae bacterium]|nr:hypothetical protein [Solirubrobacteraceae bacterium]